jgi:hypothetical protein
MVQPTPLAAKYVTHLKTFSSKYISTLLYIVICIVISYISVRLIIHWLKNKNEYYTNITNILTTTTDPVITYEKPIPTNSTAPKPTHSRRVGLYSIVEPNRMPPGHYNESKLDLLVTNGLFTIGSNWFYNLVFAA